MSLEPTDPSDLSNHPDLADRGWQAEATRQALRDHRRDGGPRGRKPKSRREPGAPRGMRVKVLSALLAAGVAGLSIYLYSRDHQNEVGIAGLQPQASIDVARPFANTPADAWSDGAAGIVAPAAEPVGAYTAEQVAAAYEHTRTALVTAYLDRDVIEKHDFEKYVRLMSPGSQAALRDEAKDPRKTAVIVARIDQQYPLLPVDPKVNGKMWAEVDQESGALAVHTNYVVAYAFAIPDPGDAHDPMEIVAVSRSEVAYLHYLGDKWEPADQGMVAGDGSGYNYSISCAAMARGELAPAYAEPARFSDGDRDRSGKSYFDPNTPMPQDSNC